MFNKLVQAINERTLRRYGNEHGLDLLTRELSEIKEISDRLFQKLDSRIEAVRAVEASLDSKINLLQALVSRVEAAQAGCGGGRSDVQVAELRRKGLKVEEIAGRLSIPAGEVELMLNLRKGKP